MVSIRCKMIVKSVLESMGLAYAKVELGEVELLEELSAEKYEFLNASLQRYGFTLMEDRKNILIEKIKIIIIEMIHYTEDPIKINFSHYISEKLDYDYTYLANLFSQVKGISIEQYIIAHKIERVKEMLVYDEYTLTEIAYQLHYSSVAHLSYQFKKVTGHTPTFFKKLQNKRRSGLEDL
jgi:hypothetical protein